MLRPSPNHGTQRLPNDNDDDDITNRDRTLHNGVVYGLMSCMHSRQRYDTLCNNVHNISLLDIWINLYTNVQFGMNICPDPTCDGPCTLPL